MAIELAGTHQFSGNRMLAAERDTHVARSIRVAVHREPHLVITLIALRAARPALRTMIAGGDRSSGIAAASVTPSAGSLAGRTLPIGNRDCQLTFFAVRGVELSAASSMT